MRIVILSLLLVNIIACSKDEKAPSSIQGNQYLNAEAFEVQGEYQSKWSREWSAIVFEELENQNSILLSTSIKSSDLASLECSEYPSLNREHRKMFWTLFISSIAHFESSFNPSLRYWEPSLGHYSEGLLQLSTTDSSNYDFCNLSRSSILEVRSNLQCGLSILAKQIEGSSRRSEGELFPRQYFYWSVLTRATTKSRLINF